jgi:hypothetical protein
MAVVAFAPMEAEMNIALIAKVIIAVAAGLAATPQAPAQSPDLKPTLEPTLKVFPAPKIEPQPQPVAPGMAECICTMQYDPVCALGSDGLWRTYSNPCQADCAGATQFTRGPC